MPDQKESIYRQKTKSSALQIDNEEATKIDGEQKEKQEDNISIESKSKQDSGTGNKESGKNTVDTEQKPEDKVFTNNEPKQEGATDNKESGKIDNTEQKPEDKLSSDKTSMKEDGTDNKESEKIDDELKSVDKICIYNNSRIEDGPSLATKFKNEESDESSAKHSIENEMWIDNEESGGSSAKLSIEDEMCIDNEEYVERNNTFKPEDETSINNKSDSEDGLPPTTISENHTDEMWLCDLTTLEKAVHNRKRYLNQHEVLDESELYSLKKVKIEDTSDDQFQAMWKYLQQDFSNFNEWINILYIVDKHNIEVNARMAYSKFLELYPLCYAYWKKYASFEKRNNNIHEFEKVLENSLSAIPISVDLWIYYMTYLVTERTNEECHIRNEFERSLKSCGLDYRSDQLWHDYISWEVGINEISNATKIFHRLIRIPTFNYLKNFFKFQEFIFKMLPEKYLGVAEFLKRRSIIIKSFGTSYNGESITDDFIPPGEDFLERPEITEDNIMTTLKINVIEPFYYLHKQTAKEFGSRKVFEENIRRTHFHVNDLDTAQIKNWENYIKFERRGGNHERIIFLHERCLIACASNETSWLNYLEYLSFVNFDVTTLLGGVFKRALFHHPNSLRLNLKYFDFSDSEGSIETAVETITKLENIQPNSREVAIRLINLARRDQDGTLGILYKHHLNCSQSKSFASFIAVKYARFVWKHDRQLNHAFDILNNTILTNEIRVHNNLDIYLTLIELKMELYTTDHVSVVALIDNIIFQCDSNKEKLVFSKKKLEYAEEYTQDYEVLRLAKAEYKQLKLACIRDKRQSINNAM